MFRQKPGLVLILMVSQFSLAFPQGGSQGNVPSYLDSFESFASVGQVFIGPLSAGTSAVTGVQVTNRDRQECEVGLLLHRGAGAFIPSDFPVRINGEPGPFSSARIPRGGVRRFDLTASEFIQGSLVLGFRTLAPAIKGAPEPCNATSFKVTATSFVLDTTPANETPESQNQLRGSDTARRSLSEAFSIAVNEADSWLCSGFCWAISTTEGMGTAAIRQRLGIATSSVMPGQAAPEGSQLRLFIYDADGSLLATRDFDVDGSHTTFFPGADVSEFGGGTMIFCLETSDPSYKMDLTVIRVNQLRDGTVQFDRAIFTDGFESGDTSAWLTGN